MCVCVCERACVRARVRLFVCLLETHIKSFENQAHALRRELEEMIEVGSSEFCCEVKPGLRTVAEVVDKGELGQLDVVDKVVGGFNKVLAVHRSRDFRWYNDGKSYHVIIRQTVRCT